MQTTPGMTPGSLGATPGSFTASGKRKLGLRQFVPQLVINLFDTTAKKRYFLLVANNLKILFLVEPVGNEMVICTEQNILKHGHIQPNTNIISVSVNDNYTKLLVNCSDRVLRLYQVHYPKPTTAK